MSNTAPRSNHERKDAELELLWENARAALDHTNDSATIPSLVDARSILRMQNANAQAEVAWRRLMPFTHEDTMHLHPAHDNAESRAGMPVLRRLELWWKATLFTEIAEVAKNWLIDRDSNSPGWHAAIQGRWPAPGLPQLTRQLSRRFQLAWASDRLVEARGHYHAAFNDPRNQGADMTAAKAQRAVAFLEAAAAALRAEGQREQPAQPRASRATQGAPRAQLKGRARAPEPAHVQDRPAGRPPQRPVEGNARPANERRQLSAQQRKRDARTPGAVERKHSSARRPADGASATRKQPRRREHERRKRQRRRHDRTTRRQRHSDPSSMASSN